MSKPRTRRRRRGGHWEVETGRARIEPEPEIDVQTGRARIRPEPYPNALYDYGEIVDEGDDTLRGGSLQTRDGHQFHETMDMSEEEELRRGR